MPDYAGEKTLDPTPHRRQQARREGHVAKSQDLASAGLLLASLAILILLGGGLVGFLFDYCRDQLGGQPWLSVDSDFAVSHLNSTLASLGRVLLPILALLCIAGVLVNVVQFGFLFVPQRLGLDLARLDPLQGFRRIFATTSLVRLGFGIVKLVVVAAVAGVVLYNERAQILGLSDLGPAGILVSTTQILFWTTVKIAGALFALAMLDYAWQWWRHEQDLKMTPQELREELRNLEGNPELIARRKQVRREVAVERIAAVRQPGEH